MNNMIGVATKGIIFRNDGKVLLITKSDKEDMNPNTIDIPGGRLEFGENLEDSLKREVKEETGLNIDVIKPSRCWTFMKKDQNFQLVGITFYCRYVGGEEKLSEEHTDFRWILPEDILNGEYPEWLKKEIKAALEIKNGNII